MTGADPYAEQRSDTGVCTQIKARYPAAHAMIELQNSLYNEGLLTMGKLRGY